MPGCGKCTNVGLKTPQETKHTSDEVQNSPGIGLIMMLMFAFIKIIIKRSIICKGIAAG